MQKKTFYSLLGFIALFVILRGGILLTAVELVSHYDELDLGTIARDLLTGLKLPFRFYQLDAYSGESLILGPLVIPFFKLFGHSLFAIKLVPFFFSLASLILLFYFLRKHFGFPAAVRGAALYLLGIPVLTQLSLVGMAGHCESAFFGLCILISFYRFIFSEEKSCRRLIPFAAFSGFGVWFYYANAMMVAACLISWLLLHKKSFLSSRFFVFAGIAAVFFSPWVILNFKSSFSGLLLLKEIFSVGTPSLDLVSFIRKNISILIKAIPFSFAVLPSLRIHENLLAFASFLGFSTLAAAAFHFKTGELSPDAKYRHKLVPLCLYLIVFFLVILGSALNIVRHHGFVGYRYLTPLFINLIMLAAVGAQKKIGRFLLPIILAVGFAGHLPLLFQEPAGRALEYRGYSYYQLGTRWRMSLPKDLYRHYDDFREVLSRFDEPDRMYLLLGMVDMAIMDHDPVLIEQSEMDVSEIIKKEPAIYSSFLYEWLGSVKMTTEEQIRQDLEKQTYPDKIRTYICNGWLGNWQQAAAMMSSPSEAVEKFSFCIQLTPKGSFVYAEIADHDWPGFYRSLSGLHEREKNWIFRSLGRAFYLDERFSQVSLKRRYQHLFADISGTSRNALLEGIGWGIRLRFIEDRVRAYDWVLKFPPQDRLGISKGIEASDAWYGYPA